MGDQNSGGSNESHETSDIPRPRFSPFSPFPYGSPLSKVNSLQTSFSGSPGQKMLLGGSSNNLSQSRTNGEVLTPRLKGQDLYGGPIIFGSSARRSRLLSASPYSAAARSRAAERQSRVSSLQPSLGRVAPPPSSLPSTAPSSPHSSPGPTVSPPAPLSSTARLILSTLEKLSSGGTPVTDAKKIPLCSPSSSGRAEKRKLLETELNCSFSPGRRRPRLGGGGLALSLAGPPLRKNFSPIPSLSSGTSVSSVTRPVQVRLKSSSPPPAPAAPASVRTSKEQREGAPPATSEASSLPTNQAKSSLKMKSKVADSGRSKVDLTAPVAVSSFSLPCEAPQLEVAKLPVFNFSSLVPAATASAPAPAMAPAPLKEIVEKPSNIEVVSSFPAHSTPSVSPIPPEVLERNNNDKSPNKRLINEADDQLTSETKKVKSAEVGEVKISRAATSVPSVEATALQADIIPRRDQVIPGTRFNFSLPQSVIASSEIEVLAVTEAHRSYNFSAPSPVLAGQNSEIKQLINGPSKSSDPGVSATIPCFNLMSSPSTSNTEIRNNIETNFLSNKSMPDITNNTLRKTSSTNKLKGSNSNSGLPDVTASTGFGGFLPAKELKTGSVMDILGKKL